MFYLSGVEEEDVPKKQTVLLCTRRTMFKVKFVCNNLLAAPNPTLVKAAYVERQCAYDTASLEPIHQESNRSSDTTRSVALICIPFKLPSCPPDPDAAVSPSPTLLPLPFLRGAAAS